jgi:lipopolysaccharide export system permease protein
MMSTLQRYILFDLLRVLALVVTATTVLLVFLGVFQKVSESGIGPLQVLEILPYIIPSMLPFTIPATLLLSVCIVYGRLSADFEITAAKAAGINSLSLLTPAFAVGAALSLCSLLLNDQVIPWSMTNIQRIVTHAMEDICFDVLESHSLYEDPTHGFSITVRGVDKKQRRLIEPIIKYAPAGRKPLTLQSRSSVLRFNFETQEIVLDCEDAYVDAPGRISGRMERFRLSLPISFNGEKPKARHLSIRDIEVQLEHLQQSIALHSEHQAIEAAFALARGDFEYLSSGEFRGHQWQRKNEEVTARKHHTELHNRFALSCSCFVFALIGGPFSILQGRRQFLTTFFVCFVPILLIYYPVVLLMINLSRSGIVHPGWAMWVGNLLLLIAAAFVMRRAVRH